MLRGPLNKLTVTQWISLYPALSLSITMLGPSHGKCNSWIWELLCYLAQISYKKPELHSFVRYNPINRDPGTPKENEMSHALELPTWNWRDFMVGSSRRTPIDPVLNIWAFPSQYGIRSIRFGLYSQP